MNIQALGSALRLTAAETPAVSEAASEAASGFLFEPMNFVSSLKYMGLGMLGIFIVIGVIIGCTYLINAVFSRKDRNRKDSDR